MPVPVRADGEHKHSLYTAHGQLCPELAAALSCLS